MSSQKGSLIVVTGPSGAGKSTLLSRVIREMKGVYYSVSATTREPRPREKEGVSYFFLTRPQFEEMIARNELLEHAEYVGNYYGTPQKAVDEQLQKGRDVVLEIEVQGALTVKEKRPDAILIFVTPSSFGKLRERLACRGSESEDVIKKRLDAARVEYRSVPKFDYLVINDDPRRALEELKAIILSNRCRMVNRINKLKKLR